MTSLTDEAWVCEKCTFINPPTEIACTICFSNRMVVKDLQTTWEWQADEKWIPYDYPTTLQIEDAYQKRESSVSLKSGFFASHRGYEIHFEWKKDQPCEEPCEEAPQASRKAFSLSRFRPKDKIKKKTKKIDISNWVCERVIQRNTDSQNDRNVRRLGTDDSSLFIVIDQSILTAEDRCCVCQMMFIEEDDDEEIEENLEKVEERQNEENDVGMKENDEGDYVATERNRESEGNTPVINPTQTPPIPTNVTTTTSTAAVTTLSNTTSVTSTSSTFCTSSGTNKNKRSLVNNEKRDKKTKIEVIKVEVEEEEEEEDIIVKLPNCTNHYFHRECIAKWIKLKGFCPYCKTSI